MKLVPKENRLSELLKFGIPKEFVKNIGKIEKLKCSVEEPKGAYFYLPQIADFKILKNFTVIPIYDAGKSFYTLVYNSDTEKIIHFELKEDTIHKDYGMNWQLLLLDIMINFFGAEEEDSITVEEFVKLGNEIGFSKAKELYKLRNVISTKDFNLTLDKEGEWREKIAKELKIM